MTRTSPDQRRARMRAHVVDFHNHVIPGVDDGARDPEETRSALNTLTSSGVRTLIATPHVDASIVIRGDRFESRMAELDAGWATLVEVAAAGFPELTVHRGAEMKLDTPDPDFSDPRLRLAGGRFVLVEFPYFTVPPRSTRVIAHIVEQDRVPVIAHPERYGGMEADPAIVQQWRAAGAYLQVNGASLIGRYGPEARSAAITLLENGWADYFSSDYHARGRSEILTYRDLLIEMGAEAQCELLMWVNPTRLLEGEAPLPVPALSVKRGLWDRITGAFR